MLLSVAIFSRIVGLLPNFDNDCGATQGLPTEQVSKLKSPLIDCGENFYDPGGPTGNYPANLSNVTTICPSNPGDYVSVRFTSFQTEKNLDVLTVLDGDNTFSNIIDGFTGTLEPFSVHANNPNGCLTFTFTSNNEGSGSGWEAEVTCVPCPSPNWIRAYATSSNGAIINWFHNWQFFNQYELEVGLPGFVPGTGAGVFTSPITGNSEYQVGGLASSTEYEAYLRIQCDIGEFGEFKGPIKFKTAPSCDNSFYDSGGPDGPLQPNEQSNVTICPDGPGQFAVVDFEVFDMATGYVVIYDGPFSSGTYLNAFTNNNPPGTIGATNNSGCLTFIAYNSTDSPLTRGWEANITCVSCPKPRTVWTESIGTNSATLRWQVFDFGSLYEWEVGPDGFMPGSGTAIASSTTNNEASQVIGLQSATKYDAYVRASCQNGMFSEWQKISFTTLPTCGDSFNDSGGPNGDYAPFENTLTVICPDANGLYVAVTFDEFQLDSCCASLAVYNSNYQGGEFLTLLEKDEVPGTLTATNPSGCLTFAFYNGGSHTAPGWTSHVECVTCPSPSGLTVYDPNQSGAAVQWSQLLTAQYYYYEVVPSGQLPGTGASVASGNVNTNSIFLTGLESGTAYEFYLKTICGANDESAFANPVAFATTPSCGDNFYDNGGPNGDHIISGYTNTTICPNIPGTYAQVVFTEFDLDPCCASLNIWDGQNSISSITGSYLPSPVTSIDPTGCLTFSFSASGGAAAPGWVANINCVTCPNPVQLYVSDVNSSSFRTNWQPTPASTGYEWELGLKGFIPGTGNAVLSGTTSNTELLVDGLESATDYEFYVRNVCSIADNSVFSGPGRIYTSPTCGDVYSDPGGPTGNFGIHPGINSLICPDVPGQYIQLEFSAFDMGECCSELTIVDAPDVFGGPSLGTFNKQNSPGTVTSNNSTGCLVVHSVYYGDEAPGWLANVNCVTCPKPNILEAQNPAGGKVDLLWSDIASNNGYDWELGLAGFEPGTGESVQAGSTTQHQIQVSGLASATNFEFYVRTKCSGNETSAFSGPFAFTMPPSCGDVFVDSGGPNGNYGMAEYNFVKICPDVPGTFIGLDFSELEVDPCCAYLSIYDGNMLNVYLDTNNNPGTVYSNAADGCLHVSFYNNSSNSTAAGWIADVLCVTCPPPTTVIRTDVVNFDGTTVHWNQVPSANSYNWEVVPVGSQPGIGEAIVSGNSNSLDLTITGLESLTEYEFYVRADCGGGDLSPFSQPLKFKTAPTCGDMFYDPAGPDSSYTSGSLYSTTVICPDVPGSVVEVEFLSLDIHPWEDNISVYNGNSTNSSLIQTFNGMAMPIPGPFVSSDPTGCLTFYLNAAAAGEWEGWKATINCSTCPKVSNLSAAVANELTLSWSAVPSATSFNWELGLPGFVPGTGSSIASGNTTNTSVLVPGLSPSTEYVAFVQSVCTSGELGSFGEGLLFKTPVTCGGTFYDMGGPNFTYNPSENYVTTICPQGVGQQVTVTFNNFETEGGTDFLGIYNGTNTNAPQLANLNGGISNIISFSSTHPSGCLTFAFTSDASGQGFGWEAEVSCTGCVPPSNFAASNLTSAGVNLSWEAATEAETYNYEIGLKGFTPGIGTAILSGNTASTSVTISNLSPDVEYEAYLRSICAGSTIGSFAEPLSFTTPSSCGSTLYDTGGPNDDYGPSENYYTLICSEGVGSSAWLEFTEFETQQCCDILEILDGNTESSPVLGSFSGNNSPGIVYANNASGCLMLHFTSDATVHRSGWKATVHCTTPTYDAAQTDRLLEVSPNPANDWLNVKLPNDQGGSLQVMDVAGRIQWQEMINAGSSQTNVPLIGLPAGIYFLRWQSAVVRFVVEP